MQVCKDYELEISALLDGESDPATALDLLEHVGACGSCGAFVGEIRGAQAKIDRAYVVSEPVPTEGSRPRRERSIRPMPRWAWAMAAMIVLVVGGYVANEATNQVDGELVVRLGENRGSMSDDRFFELTTELLGADRMYRDQMYQVLEAVRTGEAPNERGMTEAINGFAEAEGGERARTVTTNALD